MSGIYQQLDDLHKLQEASCVLEHGINNRGWKLFEPSKFVYAFFAFNSFYCINWEESQKQKELINWKSEDDTSETKKIKAMQKYIYDYYVKNVQNRLDEENKKKELGSRFVSKINEYLGMNLKDKIDILDRIVIDTRINEDEKNKFIKSIKKIVDEDILSNKIWYDILRFIYLVRNNVFHGSKTITHMGVTSQIERFKIYTAILLATNELLFDAIEENFQWTNNKRINIMLTKKTKKEIYKKRIFYL